MIITTLSRAKKAAENGPSVHRDARPVAHVLMTIEGYRRITGDFRKIADLLDWPGAGDIDLPLDRAAEKPRSVPIE